MRLRQPTKTIIARVWLLLAVIAAAAYIFTHLSYSSAHRYYYLKAVEYDSKIKIFHYMEDDRTIQSFVEGNDPYGYTDLGHLLINKYPEVQFALFRPWISSIGVTQIHLNQSGLSQTRLSQSELGKLVLAEAALNLNSPDPLWEFEQMESRGFLNLIANNPMPITKFHPENIAADLFTLVFIAGALWSVIHLVRQRLLKAKQSIRLCCSGCGYPRDGLPASISQCPECGVHFTMKTFENSMEF